MDVYSGKLDKELLKAYLETDYRVFDPPLILRIGDCNRMLDDLLASQKLVTYAYLTAHNPRSKKLADGENQKRQEQLIVEVKKLGYSFRIGESKGWDGHWPAEASLLILGISLLEADLLANAFDQNAFLFGAITQKTEMYFTKQVVGYY